MSTISREFSFDAAHRVLRHESKCRHLHGHTYRVRVSVQSPVLDDLGRVVDFSVLKREIGGWLDNYLDHNLLLNEADPLVELWKASKDPNSIVCEQAKLIFDGRDPYIMAYNPTAENIAFEIFNASVGLLAVVEPTLRVVRVEVWETEKCSAEYSE